MDKYIYSIWLNFLDIPTDKKVRLIEHFGSAQAIYEASEEEYISVEFLNHKYITVLNDKNLNKSKKELKEVEKGGYGLVSIEDDIYPKNLLEIYDPPILLYTYGNKELLRKELAFCIVGSRNCTEYGLTAALNIATQIAECGMLVVSGCAIGIDSAAHQGALRAGKGTIGVMACGINVNYPPGNGALRRKIAETGLFISEFPLNTPAYSWNFQKRNRILSGISLGVAVIEAGLRSGALITARHAKEQNRDVFTLPGNITSRTSAGCNNLIHEGAAAILGAETILAEYLPKYPHLFEIDDYMEEYRETHREQEEAEEEFEAVVPLKMADNADKADEKKVIRCLKSGEKTFDEILEETQFDISKLNVLLISMQINGKIGEKMGRIFYLK